ncbi:DUF6350 family protein [Nocardioides sp.]|uniref:cell division protein PerM n=1 Tax=Nocardioides sp. TaxID=35761 RepID=UPI001A227084|nr:DUF6350 family protein [Nocardioides sp.]MBJ7357651.1 hypothetical protein [Nocardioides sp.]
MTALLPDRETRRSAAEVSHDLRHRRPLVLLAGLAGVLAAGGTLVVCLAVGVAGWFLTDAGAHGAPRDGLQTGALAWLMAHGSGVRVDGVLVTVVPLGITLVCAWATWRTAHRLGDSVSGHGPDADRIADGERDWTVLVAGLVFTAGYVGTAVLAGTLASTPSTGPDLLRVVLWAVVLCVLCGVPAIAAGSGRASVWGAGLPPSVVATAATCRSVLTTWAWVCLAFFLGALVLDFGTALNLVSQLGTDGAGTALLVLVSLVLAPNATLFSGSYLLGPGFTVGVRTIVSPAEVTVGALPVFPMLAALPDSGPTPGWTPWLVGLPPVVAALGVARAQRRRPTLRYEEGALHGCGGGMLAGAAFGVLVSLAGGAVGPGRMTDVGPLVGSTMVHAITAFGIGGLIGGLAMTWWQRRSSVAAA